MTLGVHSEVDRLEAVVFHRPGPELDLMTPEHIEAYRHTEAGIEPNPSYLLFDDLVLLSRLRDEHYQIVAVLKATCAPEGALDARDMLRTILHDPQVRDRILEGVLALEREQGHAVDKADEAALRDLDPHLLVRALLRGLLPSGRRVLAWPTPNLMFARDLGAVVGNTRLLTYAAKPARRREMLLSRALLAHHPVFEGGGPILDVAEVIDHPMIEGGDVLVPAPGQVLIGVGERTDRRTAVAAARLLLNAGAEEVHLVALRSARATMHLDTVFTLVDHQRCLVYAPQVLSREGANVTTIGRDGRERARQGSLVDVLRESGLRLTTIPCGGNSPIQQAREQWSDGANAFALGPGKIILYARNEATLRRLNESGFEVLTPAEYCRNAALILGDASRRVVVAIEGSELSRGRGGPRCLTFPIRRRPSGT